MQIRPAKHSDYSTLLGIRASELTATSTKEEIEKLGKTGFLVGGYSMEEFEFDLTQTFLILEDNQKMIGYVILSSKKEYLDNELKSWNDPKIKTLYYSNDSLEFTSIVIAPDYHHQGLGTKLFEAALDKIRDEFQYLFSIVSMSPVCNLPSYQLHLKQGFAQVADSKPYTLLGIKNYRSILMMLPLLRNQS